MTRSHPVNNTRLLTARVMHFVSFKSDKNSLTGSTIEFEGEALLLEEQCSTGEKPTMQLKSEFFN